MKTAFITGSSKGIGRQIGEDLMKKKVYVYFNGRRTLQMHGSYRSFITADLSDMKSINKIAKKIDKLDILILNVGTTDRTEFGNITLENWNSVLDLNLTNQFFLIQKLKDKMQANGRIIFISSISSIVPDSVSIAYGVSKAAVNALVMYLAKEFANKKITVNAIAPGYIDTDWHREKPKDQIERIAKKCLAKRLGTTEEISKAVQAIIDNDFINGQVIRVDGGFGL